MPSDAPPSAYVWTWLPGQTTPVVAGVLEKTGDFFTFTYGQSYRQRPDAGAIANVMGEHPRPE